LPEEAERGQVAHRLSVTAVLCRGLEKNCMVRTRHGCGMASVNQTRPHCANQMGKTHSKHLAARHGRGTAWARHAMCESAFTGQNTLRRHFHLMGLSDSTLCRRCGAEDETSAHILCQCEALVSLRHAYLGSFYLDPEDIKSISLEASWNFSKVTGLPSINMGPNVLVS
jgi:hypothetical protein